MTLFNQFSTSRFIAITVAIITISATNPALAGDHANTIDDFDLINHFQISSDGADSQHSCPAESRDETLRDITLNLDPYDCTGWYSSSDNVSAPFTSVGIALIEENSYSGGSFTPVDPDDLSFEVEDAEWNSPYFTFDYRICAETTGEFDVDVLVVYLIGNYVMDHDIAQTFHLEVETPYDVTVMQPGSASSWEAGTVHNVTWSDNFSGNVRIYLYRGSEMVDLISNGTPANGFFSWEIDPELPQATNYRVKVIKANDTSVYDYSSYFSITPNHTGVADLDVPITIELLTAYPNPFNPSTTISYNLVTGGAVEVSVYNSQGQLVETLVNGFQAPGAHQVTFNAQSLPSGSYFYRVTQAGFSTTQKLTLVK